MKEFLVVVFEPQRVYTIINLSKAL